MTKDNNKPVQQPASFQRLIFTQDIAPGNIKQQHLLAYPVATGTLYYGKDGNFVNIPIGTTGQILMVVGGVPAWEYMTQTGVAASRPTTGRFTGDGYYSTDTFTLSMWTGAAWKSVVLA